MFVFLVILLIAILYYLGSKYEDRFAISTLSILLFVVGGGMGLLLIAGGLFLLYQIITNYKEMDELFNYCSGSFFLILVGCHWVYGVYKFGIKKDNS